MNANDGGPAFPQHGWSSNPEVLERMKTQGGMTLRDWFAGQALAGICASIDHGELEGYYMHKVGSRGDSNIPYPSSIAEHAHAIADAMLKAREVKP